MSVPFLILNVAYLTLVSSTLTRSLKWLRVTLTLAAATFVLYGIVEGIWSMIFWNSATGSMHLFRILQDYRQQQSVKLTAPERATRDEFFPGLSDFDFHLLWRMGEQVEYSNEAIVVEQTMPDTVSLILEGTVAIKSANTASRWLHRGGLVGEMSFVSGRTAEVSAVAQDHVVVRQWDQRQLASLDQLRPSSFRAFRDLMSRDLVAKARANL